MAEAGGATAAGSASAFREGMTDILPLLVGLVPFALLLGALAVHKGLSPLEVALMSALVFAGSSQFLAIELWREPVPIFLLAAMALLVNSRHVLMGVALAPRLEGQPQKRVWPALFFMADEVWAMTLASRRRGRTVFAYYTGLGVGLWLNWVFWSVLGALAGAFLQDPARYGLDFAFVAVFLVLLKGMWHGPFLLVPWSVSGIASALAHELVPGPSYVAIGALAGLVTALLARRAPA